MEVLYQITAPYYCAAVYVIDGKVVGAAPILGWAFGKSWEYCESYFLKKGHKIERVFE